MQKVFECAQRICLNNTKMLGEYSEQYKLSRPYLSEFSCKPNKFWILNHLRILYRIEWAKKHLMLRTALLTKILGGYKDEFQAKT